MKDTKIRCRNAKETEEVLKVIEERHPEVKWQSGSNPTKFNPFTGCGEDDGGYLAIRCDRITFANNDEVRDGDFDDAMSVKRFMRRHNTTVHIHQKGNMVIAHESQTGREGIAKCSPEDKFDFYTGAKLALARLYGDEFIPFEAKKPEVTIAEGHCSYKVGDKVVVKSPLSVVWRSTAEKSVSSTKCVVIMSTWIFMVLIRGMVSIRIRLSLGIAPFMKVTSLESLTVVAYTRPTFRGSRRISPTLTLLLGISLESLQSITVANIRSSRLPSILCGMTIWLTSSLSDLMVSATSLV